MNCNTKKVLEKNPLSSREIYVYQTLSKINLSIDMSTQAIMSDIRSFESMSEEESTLDGMKDLLFSSLERFDALTSIIQDFNDDLYSFNVRNIRYNRGEVDVNSSDFTQVILKGI